MARNGHVAEDALEMAVGAAKMRRRARDADMEWCRRRQCTEAPTPVADLSAWAERVRELRRASHRTLVVMPTQGGSVSEWIVLEHNCE